MKTFLLARFTPSLTAPEDLEAIFVQREAMAGRLLSRIQSSVTSANKHHSLLIGPRGIGKTHLLTLVRNRLAAQPEISSRSVVAWLREEEWGIMSFLDLLLRILRSLAESTEVQVPADELDALHDLPPTQAERKATRLLLTVVGEKTLVLFMENLDDVFQGLSQREQRAFRAFVQDHEKVAILATSPGLFDGVSRRSSPFFGFFSIQNLEEFSFDDAAELLFKIATRRGQHELASFMRTPTGRARVRAIHHLAQGNPRVYVIFSEFLTRQSLDDLAGPVLRMLDDLTPYYQARISSLSTQQRKIVEFLAGNRTPIVVRAIARRGFISPQTASSQLKKLTEIGFVRSERSGRESYYELREPLMRFCLDLKKERKEPLRPLLEILRIWWTPSELELQLRGLGVHASVTSEYLVRALEWARNDSVDPRVSACRKDFHALVKAKHMDRALTAAEDWVTVSRDGESLFNLAYTYAMLDKWEAAWDTITEATALEPDSANVAVVAVGIASNLGKYEVCLALTRQARSLASSDEKKEEWYETMVVVEAWCLLQLERLEECVEYCNGVLQSKMSMRQRNEVVQLLARSLLLLGRSADAESLLEHSTDDDAVALFLLAVAQYRLQNVVSALRNLERSIAREDSVRARLTRAKILAEEQQWDEIVSEIECALELSPIEVEEWSPTLCHIALLSLVAPVNTTRGTLSESFRGFLDSMNVPLASRGVKPIKASQVIALMGKTLASGENSYSSAGWVSFFEKHSFPSDDREALTLLETVLEYVGGRNEASLLRLPLEERQLVAGLLSPKISNSL